jgi:hypothetical protein
MRRSLDDALLALRGQVKAWATGARPDIRVFVYPPDCEALLLARIPIWALERAKEGLAVDVVDIGQEFRTVVSRRRAGPALAELERRSAAQAMESLRSLAREAILGAIQRPLEPPAMARLIVNSGSLASFASYSAITNEFHGAAESAAAPVAIAFPGEGDDRTLSLLNLRPDANYRVPRI